MKACQHNRLININRVLILALTLSGLLMDGLQLADLLCTLALFVWLWLPLCTRLEAQMLQWMDDKHVRSDRHNHFLLCNPTNGKSH